MRNPNEVWGGGVGGLRSSVSTFDLILHLEYSEENVMSPGTVCVRC